MTQLNFETKKKTSELINYVMDGPCGDCPKCFTCSEDCVSLIAWDKSKVTVRKLEKVSE